VGHSEPDRECELVTKGAMVHRAGLCSGSVLPRERRTRRTLSRLAASACTAPCLPFVYQKFSDFR
jgi:hypothetical protein